MNLAEMLRDAEERMEKIIANEGRYGLWARRDGNRIVVELIDSQVDE